MPEKRPCVICGAAFKPRDARIVTCSKPCSLQRQAERHAERRRTRYGWRTRAPRGPASADAEQRRQQGFNRYLSDPRRAAPTSLRVIVAARRRGWTTEQIAFAAGVTDVAINLRLRKYETRQGAIIPHKPPKRTPRRIKVSTPCAYCGQPVGWRRVNETIAYCGALCQEAASRAITDAMVETAISQRLSGATWTLVRQLIGFPVQSIQARMWKYLFVHGALNRETVDQLWLRGTRGRRAGYAWLEKNTGLIPVEGGTRLGTKAHRKGAPAWRGFIRQPATDPPARLPGNLAAALERRAEPHAGRFNRALVRE